MTKEQLAALKDYILDAIADALASESGRDGLTERVNILKSEATLDYLFREVE